MKKSKMANFVNFANFAMQIFHKMRKYKNPKSRDIYIVYIRQGGIRDWTEVIPTFAHGLSGLNFSGLMDFKKAGQKKGRFW